MIHPSLQDILDGLWEPAILLGPQLHVVAANEPFYRIAGLTPATTLGAAFADLDGGRWSDLKLIESVGKFAQHDAQEAHHLAGGDNLKHHFKMRRLSLDGESGPVILVTIAALDEGMTKEDVRQVYWAELDHVFRQRVGEHMISALSHELAQPLSAITGFAHASMRTMNAAGELPPHLGKAMQKTSEAMQLIASEADRAGRLIRRIRGFVRHQAPEQRPVDLNAVVGNMIGFVTADASARGIVVTAELEPGLPPVRADWRELAQVVVNLLRNAMEAVEAGARADRRIIVRTSAAADGAVQVSIADSGPGMPPDIAERMFMPFVSGTPDRLGLGLSLCRAIVNDHGGRIWVAEEDGRSNTICFSLPAAERGAGDDD